MEPIFFLKGLVIGFSIAAPVGPIGILCIRRTLMEGRISGLVSGLGAATADAIYGGIAAFGLTFISSFLVHQQTWFRLMGGLFLFYLGTKTFLSKPAQHAAMARGKGLLGSYTSTLFLTLANPMTILFFTAIFAGVGIASGGGDYRIAGILILGVFVGSSLWWLILSGGVGVLRMKFTPSRLLWVNKISGAIIAAFGIVVLLQLMWGFARKPL